MPGFLANPIQSCLATLEVLGFQGFRVLGFFWGRVQGLGVRVWGLGFRVSGFRVLWLVLLYCFFLRGLGVSVFVVVFKNPKPLNPKPLNPYA